MSDARTRLGNPFVPAGPRKEFPKKRKMKNTIKKGNGVITLAYASRLVSVLHVLAHGPGVSNDARRLQYMAGNAVAIPSEEMASHLSAMVAVPRNGGMPTAHTSVAQQLLRMLSPTMSSSWSPTTVLLPCSKQLIEMSRATQGTT